ncbi:MAG: hypothetical protein IPM46_15005 [Flavobacteriales bacterium]|nr:hypothetical protein [Flavobacteriales bacterium]
MSTARHLLLLAGMLMWLAGRAQTTPEDYFNLAARQYVKEDKRQALRTLDLGLRAHPEDRKLRGLAEALLKNEQQNQQEQQQEQQNKEEQEQQKKQEEQAKQEEQRQQEEAQQEEQQQEGDQERNTQPRAGEISQKDAERMLDALERREQDVQQQVRARLRPARRVPVEKDW